jgi:hypothetical protein
MTATVPMPTTEVAVAFDETSFYAADVRRRLSEEAEYGALWRHAEADGDEIWRLAYVCDTGELYLARCDPYPGPNTELRVLGVFAAQNDVETMLVGWREHCGHVGSLDWLLSRTSAIRGS